MEYRDARQIRSVTATCDRFGTTQCRHDNSLPEIIRGHPHSYPISLANAVSALVKGQLSSAAKRRSLDEAAISAGYLRIDTVNESSRVITDRLRGQVISHQCA
jgi:hypothetical protein